MPQADFLRLRRGDQTTLSNACAASLKREAETYYPFRRRQQGNVPGMR